jgi:hypothetical protein
MTQELWIQIVVSLAPTLMALAAVITAIKNGNKIQELHSSIKAERAIRDTKTLQVAEALKTSTADIAKDLKSNTAEIAKDLAK